MKRPFDMTSAECVEYATEMRLRGREVAESNFTLGKMIMKGAWIIQNLADYKSKYYEESRINRALINEAANLRTMHEADLMEIVRLRRIAEVEHEA